MYANNGTAYPVTETPIVVLAFVLAPFAICSATGELTTPNVSMKSCLTPRRETLDSLEYVMNPHLRTSDAPIPLAIVPHYMSKTSFTDVRDADGGKFLYEELPKIRKNMRVEMSEILKKLTLERRPPKNILLLDLSNEKLIIKSFPEMECIIME